MHPFLFFMRLASNAIRMKPFTKIVVIALTLLAGVVHGQSASYQALKDNFKKRPDVVSISVGGWMCRLVLRMADEYEFNDAIRKVRHVRLITIPAKEFDALNLSVNGFKKVLKKDSFEELSRVREKGETVTVYLQESGNNKNRYFVLVEADDQITGIEIKGYIDPKVLQEKTAAITEDD